MGHADWPEAELDHREGHGVSSVSLFHDRSHRGCGGGDAPVALDAAGLIPMDHADWPAAWYHGIAVLLHMVDVMKAPGSSGGLSVSATRHFRRLTIMLQ